MEVKLKTRLTAVMISLLLVYATFTWLSEVHGQSLTVKTDKKVYGAGELVKVWGTATPFAFVTIQVYDPKNDLVATDQVRATGEGTYEASFRLPSKIPYGTFKETGTYRVRVASQGVTAETTFDFSVAVTPPKPAPVEVAVLTPQKVEVNVNVTRVLEAKMSEVEVKVQLAIAPQLKEVSVVIDKALPKGVPIRFNLTQAVEVNVVVKELTLSVYDRSAGFRVSVHLPEKVKVVAPKPVESLTVKPSVEAPEVPKGWVKVLPVVDIGPSGVEFDKPAVVNFTYTDEAVKGLGVDEKRLTIAFYDEKEGKWVTLKSVVDVERNVVCAEVKHLTLFTVAQTPLPAEFKVSSLVINPIEVLTGQAVEVSVKVKNVGEEVGEYTVTLKVGDRVEGSKTITLAGGVEETVKFTLVKEQPGSYSVDVNGLTGSFNVKQPLKPAEFKLVKLTVNPLKVKVGETVTVTVEASNVGGQEGVKTVSLKVNGVVEATKEVVVKAGGVETVSFTLAKKDPGTYTVEVDGLTSTFTVEAPPPSRCMIATATYGSELTPEVQFLRGFRDNVVLSTFAGGTFMEAFNSWYYSWSPTVAEAITQNPTLKEVVKVLLYPLIGILRASVVVHPALSFNHELGVVTVGMLISALIGVTYLTPIITIVLLILKRGGRKPKSVRVKTLTIPWLSGLTLTALGVATSSPAITMIATTTLVLTTMSLSALTVANEIVRRVT